MRAFLLQHRIAHHEERKAPIFSAQRSVFTAGIITFALLTGAHGSAQSNEVGFLAGSTLTPGISTSTQGLSFRPSLALGIEYDHRFVETRFGSLLGGVDFTASPLDVITSAGPSAAINEYAYVFLTPELRYKAPSVGPVRPWVSVGGGLADFREGKLRNGQLNTASGTRSGTRSGTAEFSGGVDSNRTIRLLFPIGFRVEVRDYLSAQPRYDVPTSGSTQNNVVLSAGFYLKF